MRSNKLRIMFCATLAALLAGVLPGVSEAQGTSGAASLSITPGARADGMGRAQAAIVNDGTSGWWNPASLGRIQERVVSLMHTQLVPDLADDVYYEYLGYVQPLEGWGGFGVNFIYLTYGESIATTSEGEEIGTFSSYELSPAVSGGTELAPGLYAGVTLKFVYVYLAPSHINGVPLTDGGVSGTGNTFGADLGVLYEMTQLPVPVYLAAVVQNLGPDIAYIDEDQADPLGRNLKLGFAVSALRNENVSLIGTFDFNKSLVFSDEDPIYNFGAELAYGILALRGGYIHDRLGDITDPTFGFGLRLPSPPLSFEFASVPQAEGLARVQKYSLNFRF